jgi:hypothetical protein
MYLLANRDISQYKKMDRISVDEYYTLLGCFIRYNDDMESKMK